MPTKTSNRNRAAQGKSGVEYAEEMKKVIDLLGGVIATALADGYKVSAKISYGRLISVGCNIACDMRGRPQKCASAVDVESDEEV